MTPTDARCDYVWCTTAHGHTVHPDDEAHRSVGRAVLVRRRDDGDTGPGDETEAELGLLRRASDSDTWLVLEDGAGLHVEVTVDSARRMIRTLLDDDQLRAEFGIDD